jgi:sugar fermentation stimulation protein A
VTVPLQADLAGRLVRRYRRFFADVALADGRVVTVHCPDPGSMRGAARPGAAVRCSTSDDPRRALRHTLEMIRVGRTWVGVNTVRANAIAAAALAAGALPALAGYAEVRREVAAGDGSRLDFRLDGRPGDPRPLWLEVKSVTWAEGPAGRFPDSVTERGRRHAQTLARLGRAGARAALLFVVQRADCAWVEPADELDPRYGAALREAARAGVEVLAVRSRVSPHRIVLDGPLDVRL